tara:strand:- start:2748 stop:3590 length:843 start_codon:yes stop_codon:yes gene_type:complete
MSKKDITIIDLEDLNLQDTTAETRYINNSTKNYDSYQEMMKAPIRVLEKMALGAFFTSKDEFEADPTDLGPMDCKLMHQALMTHIQTLEGIIKSFKMHGEDTVVDGDCEIQRRCKETGELEEVIQLTAVENLLQAASIGTYVELVCNTQQQGDDEKVRILNALLKNTDDQGDTVLKTAQEMKDFLKEGDKIGDLMRALVDDYGKDIHIQQVFKSARDLAVVLSDHKDGKADFMTEYKRRLFTEDSLEEMPTVDKNILIKKAEDLTKELLTELTKTAFPSK